MDLNLLSNKHRAIIRDMAIELHDKGMMPQQRYIVLWKSDCNGGDPMSLCSCGASDGNSLHELIQLVVGPIERTKKDVKMSILRNCGDMLSNKGAGRINPKYYQHRNKELIKELKSYNK